MKKIESTQNPLLKEIVRLRKARHRRLQDLVVVDGLREIKVAYDYGFEFVSVFFCPEISDEKWPDSPLEPIELGKDALEKIAYAENPNGWIAVIRPKYQKLLEVKTSNRPLILILEEVEKPGNLGAMLRSAYAAGMDLIILNNPQTDIYNPNVIKASSGHIFSDQVVVASKEETLFWLKKNKIKIYATDIKAAKTYTDVEWREASAVVMGTEATGISDFWKNEANQNIIIPMRPGIDSLNVSVSAAIIMFEAKRQRDLLKK